MTEQHQAGYEYLSSLKSPKLISVIVCDGAGSVWRRCFVSLGELLQALKTEGLRVVKIEGGCENLGEVEEVLKKENLFYVR